MSISAPGERKGTVVDRLIGKVSKESAGYRPAHGEAHTKISCAECEYYQYPGQPTSSCAKVAGVVEARDTCDLFQPAVSAPTHQHGQGVSVHVHVQP